MFTIVENRMNHLDIGEYTSFGIAAHGSASVDVVVYDISTDRQFVEELVQRFEAEQLAPEHLRDAVEDAIILSSILSD